MKKILFITTTNLSTNPRILKELKLALENGYECTFIGFKLGNWSDKTEPEHLKLFNGLKAIYLSAGTSAHFDSAQGPPLSDQHWWLRTVGNRWLSVVRYRWLSVVSYRWLSVVEAPYLTTLLSKLSIIFNKFFKKNLKIAAYAHNKRSWQIKNELRKLKDTYDLIIAHNLGALYPAFKFARKHHIPFAFDIEDYHPGEKCSPAEKRRREFIMQQLLPKAAYISYASPLIGEHSLELLANAPSKKSGLDRVKYLATGTKCISRTVCDTDMLEVNVIAEGVKLPQSILINNSFSQSEFKLKEIMEKKIQFVWFSQNIARGRGLEMIIPALAKYKDKIHLTLIGNLYKDFKESFLKDYLHFIDIKPPLPQKELNQYLSNFDIGLAIELSAADFNRDICLTNKIFAYAQSGLFILATDTSAQKMFIEGGGFGSAQPPGSGSLSGAEMTIGFLSQQSTKAMEKVVSFIIDEVATIRANKKARFEYAKRLAWEHEGNKLLSVWQGLK